MNGEMEQGFAAWVKHDCARFPNPAKRYVAAEISDMLATMNCQISEYGGYKKTDVQE